MMVEKENKLTCCELPPLILASMALPRDVASLLLAEELVDSGGVPTPLPGVNPNGLGVDASPSSPAFALLVL